MLPLLAHSLQENVFRCFEAWVRLGSFTAEELSSTILLPSLFKVALFLLSLIL